MEGLRDQRRLGRRNRNRRAGGAEMEIDMTFDELKSAGFVVHHACSICNRPVGYCIHPVMAAAVFNSGCGCSGEDNYRLLTNEELASIEGPK